MTWLRHSTRHITRTIADHLQINLNALGWMGPTVPFGAPALQTPIRTRLPNEFEALAKLDAGTIAVTNQSELPSEDQELGGPLQEQEIPLFLDVFMDDEAHAWAVALDVRDILLGRFASTARIIAVTDYSQTPPATASGWEVEFDDVIVVQHDRLPGWRTVKFTAMAHFNEARGGV